MSVLVYMCVCVCVRMHVWHSESNTSYLFPVELQQIQREQ